MSDLPIGGPAALLAALDRARSGRMRTSSRPSRREQDEIIRAPLSGVLVVQGGPGTGKTAVALHRAAYLLYTHRFPLERQGVLVVGPNPLFLRYIEQVLPSLGETGVTLSTVSGLVPEIRVRGEGPVEVARLKGDVRMAKVIARAVSHPAAAVGRGRRRSLRCPGPPTHRRRQPPDRRGRPPPARHPQRPAPAGGAQRGPTAGRRARQTQQTLGMGVPEAVTAFPGYEDPSELAEDEFDFEDFSRKVRRVPELADALDRMWPRLSPHELLHDLFGAPPLIDAAGRGVLHREEQALLHRPRSSSFDEVRVDGGRRRAGRRGPPPARSPAPGAATTLPPVRPHRGRRGAGPLAHAAADAHPPIPVRVDDRGGGHRPGHRAVGPGVVDGDHRAPAPPTSRPGPWS